MASASMAPTVLSVGVWWAYDREQPSGAHPDRRSRRLVPPRTGPSALGLTLPTKPGWVAASSLWMVPV